MMAVFFFGIGGASIFTGLADGPTALAIGLALMGLFASIYHPVGIALIVSNAVNQGRSLGYNGVSGSIGAAVAALVAGALTDWISWRAAFIVPGAAAIVTGVIFLLLARGGRINKRTSKELGEQPDVSRRTMIYAMAVFSVTLLCAGLIYQVMAVGMPKIVAERVSDINIMGTLGVGGMVTAVYLSSSLAQILGGYMADRFPLKTVYVLSYLIQAPVFYFAAMAGGYTLLIFATALVALGVGAAPAETALISRFSPAKWRATAFGAKFAVALGVSALGVPLVAVIYDNTGGFYWLFVILGALAAILAAAAMLLPSPEGVGAALPAQGPAPEAGVQGD
jgi:MFS family permease